MNDDHARVVAVVQARMGSSRLPGKALRPLQGRPLIAHVLERAQAIAGVHAVLLATTSLQRDDLLVAEVEQLGTAVVRGSEHDVLSRMFTAAKLAGADIVMRITGDCPFLDPRIAEQVLALYRAESARGALVPCVYAWNDTVTSGYPDGTDVEVFSFAMMEDAYLHATSPFDREHVTPFLRNRYRVATLRNDQNLSWIKLSVDSIEDYVRAKTIMARVPKGDYSLNATLLAFNFVTGASCQI